MEVNEQEDNKINGNVPSHQSNVCHQMACAGEVTRNSLPPPPPPPPHEPDFAEPIAAKFERSNALLEAEYLAPENALDKLDRHFKALMHECLITMEFSVSIKGQLLIKVSIRDDFLCRYPGLESENAIKKVKERFLNMRQECVDQVKYRIPEYIKIFRGLSSFHPSKGTESTHLSFL